MAEPTSLDDACKALDSIDMQAIRYEVETLRAIRDWAMARLPIDYQPGDRVVIVSDEPSDTKPGSGWYPYRRDLAPGQTGIAAGIKFNRAHGAWQVDVVIDCEDGRAAHFYMDLAWVTKREEQPS